MYVSRGGACDGGGGVLVEFLVVEVGVGLEGFRGGSGAGREDLCVEFGGSVVAHEFAGLML
jgi:hypothetical protein